MSAATRLGIGITTAMRQLVAGQLGTSRGPQTDANPGGLPIDVFDGLRADLSADRSQFSKDPSAPLYGANRPGNTVSQGLRDSFWLLQGLPRRLATPLPACSSKRGIQRAYRPRERRSVALRTLGAEDAPVFGLCRRVTHGWPARRASSRAAVALVAGASARMWMPAPRLLRLCYDDGNVR
jgi:hypothetical protein